MGSAIIDWWNAVVEGVTSEDVLNQELEKDGRHHGKCPSLAFFNEFLEQVDRVSTRHSRQKR